MVLCRKPIECPVGSESPQQIEELFLFTSEGFMDGALANRRSGSDFAIFTLTLVVKALYLPVYLHSYPMVMSYTVYHGRMNDIRLTVQFSSRTITKFTFAIQYLVQVSEMGFVRWLA